MELPITIKYDLKLYHGLVYTDVKFNKLILAEHTITKKYYAKCDYTDNIYHINEDIMLSKHLVGIEMIDKIHTNIEDYNDGHPMIIEIIFTFASGMQMGIVYKDLQEAKDAFAIIKKYYNYINDL